MYSDVILDHFQNPRHVGELPAPAVVVEVTNPACGDILRLSAVVEAGCVRDAAYRVRGCTASVAAGSVLTEWMVGKSREQLSGLTAEMLDNALGGLPAASKHAAALCIDGVREIVRAAGRGPAPH